MGHLRAVLEADVIIAFNTYMQFLYMIGGIRCPTKVYFGLSTLAGDSRCDNLFCGTYTILITTRYAFTCLCFVPKIT